MTDTADRVRAFIIRASRVRTLDDDEDILQTGMVNSLLLAQLLGFVEEQLGMELSDQELLRENFRSVAAITALIESKQASRAVA